MCGKSLQLCPTMWLWTVWTYELWTLWTLARQAPLSVRSPGKNTRVGCHAPLQGIFPTQGSNPPLLLSPALAAVPYHQCHLGCPLCVFIYVHFLERRATAFSRFSKELMTTDLKNDFPLWICISTSPGELSISVLLVKIQWKAPLS